MDDLAQTDIDIREIMKKLINPSEQKLLYNESNLNYEPTLTLNEKISYLSQIIRLRNSSYTIHSHRKIAGPLLVFMRGLITSENRRYVDPLLHQQNNVNRVMFEVITHLAKENDDLRSDILKIKQDHESTLR